VNKKEKWGKAVEDNYEFANFEQKCKLSHLTNI
jgi:hypothetical protein